MSEKSAKGKSLKRVPTPSQVGRSKKPGPKRPGPKKPGPKKPGPKKPGPKKPGPKKSEPNKPEAKKPEPNKREPNNPEPNKPEPNKPEPNKPEPNNPEPNKPETNKPEPNKPEPNKPESNKPGPSDLTRVLNEMKGTLKKMKEKTQSETEKRRRRESAKIKAFEIAAVASAKASEGKPTNQPAEEKKPQRGRGPSIKSTNTLELRRSAALKMTKDRRLTETEMMAAIPLITDQEAFKKFQQAALAQLALVAAINNDKMGTAIELEDAHSLLNSPPSEPEDEEEVVEELTWRQRWKSSFRKVLNWDWTGGSSQKNVKDTKKSIASLRQIPRVQRLVRSPFQRKVIKHIRGQPANQIQIPFFIRFISSPYFIVAFETLICICAYVYFFHVTYEFYFSFENEMRQSLLTALDIIFLVDFLFRLLVELWRFSGDVEYTIFLMPTTIKFWLIQALALFPFDHLARFSQKDFRSLETVVFLKFNRSILWFRLFRILDILNREDLLSEYVAFMFRFLAIFTGLAHFVACLYFRLAGASALEHIMSRADIADSWLEDAHKIKFGLVPFAFNDYLLSLELSVSMFSTTGYGDLSPSTELEMLLGILVMLIGGIGIAGYFTSFLTGLFLAKDAARYQLFSRLALIESYLAELGASGILLQKTREYYECLWNYREGVFRAESIRDLPTCIYEDILFDISVSMFDKSSLLRHLDEPFLRDLSKTVQVHMYNPDMIMCRQGAPGSKMYFIIRGECLVKSMHDVNKVTAVLRPGCVFGDTNLIFSLPYSGNIETRTCSQFLVIHKDAMLNVCHKHPHSLAVMRARLQKRLGKLQADFELTGKSPLEWVVPKRRQSQRRSSLRFALEKVHIEFRWASGLNRKVKDGDVDLAADPIIVHMPADENKFQRAIGYYDNCVAPLTLMDQNPILRLWHAFIQVLVVGWLVVMSIRLVFPYTDTIDPIVLDFVDGLDIAVSIIFAVDVLVQIFTAVPSTGMYYKFRDGMSQVWKDWALFIDLVSTVPLTMGYVIGGETIIGSLVVLVLFIFGRFFKLLRFYAYLNHLDERYPFHIFAIRLLGITAGLLLNVMIGAAFLFWSVCPRPHRPQVNAECKVISWLDTQHILADYARENEKKEQSESLTANVLASTNALLISFYFMAATTTSAGFGDISPQSPLDFIIVIFIQTFATILAAYFTPKLTSALVAAGVAKLRFEEKIISVNGFFKIHGISMSLRDRITEHFKLRYQFNRGVLLPRGVRHWMYDAPPYISDDSLYAELSVHLEGVPIFSHADPAALITMSKLVRRHVLPPNITFVRRGDVRRQLYIVSKGSVAILEADGGGGVKSILLETGHFGLRDLLYGEPYFNDVKTLSYCVILVIDVSSFHLVFDEDDSLVELIQKNKLRNEERVRALNYVFQKATKSLQETKERKSSETPSWIKFPTKEKPDGELCTYEEFVQGYQGALGCLMKLVLMKRTVHPAGTFALVWCILMAMASLLDMLILLFEIFPQYLTPYFSFFIFPVKLLFAINTYVQLHWAFYTKDSQRLVFHPVQTAKNYLLEGRLVYAFLVDLLPYSETLFLVGATDWNLGGQGFRWSLKIQYHLFFHIPRLLVLFQFGRNVNFYRTAVVTIIYTIVILAFGTCMSCIALYIACPWDQSKWDDSFPKKLPACFAGTWMDNKENLRNRLPFGPPRYVLATYYILQAMFAVGYGDLVTPNPTELRLMIFVLIFGYLASRIIQADITASSDTGDETRLEYAEKMKRLQAVLRKQRVDPQLARKIDEHLEHAWLLSKGLQPEELMKELHPALQTDLFKEYVGDALTQVPLLAGISQNALRTLFTYLKKVHFIRGAPITKRGALEFEMYIVVEGYVVVTGEEAEVLCCLGPGETIGETQMMYGMVRRYSAIAVTNVEALAMDATDFSEMLEHYPTLLHELEARMNFFRADLFERKIELMEAVKPKLGFFIYAAAMTRLSLLVKELSRYEVMANEPETAPAQRANWTVYKSRLSINWNVLYEWRKELPKFIKSKVIGWGEEDVGLPYIYFARPPERQRKISWLLHPRCGFMQNFSTLILLVSWLSAALSIYLVVFAEYKEDASVASLVITIVVAIFLEIIYLAHVILQFFTAVATVEGRYCKEPGKVIFRYLTSFTRFGLDLISFLPIPIQFFPFLSGDNNFKYLYLVRVLRLVHYYRSLQEGYEKISVTAFQHHFIISCTSFALMIHILASLFYGVSPCLSEKDCVRDTWTYDFIENARGNGGKADKDAYVAWRWYVRSMYWVAATITTTGFGDIVGISLPELVVSIICIFCGAFLLAIITSEFTHGVTSLNKFKREYFYQLKIDANYLESLGLSKPRSTEFVQWATLRWNFSRGCSFQEAVEILPLTLREYVNVALFHNILSRVPLFHGMENRFYLTLASYVEHSFYLPGQTIVNQGDQGNTLFIIVNGRVSGFDHTRVGSPRLLRWYDTGCLFGRLPTLFYGETYNKTYRAETLTEVLTLSKHSVFYLCRYFHDFATRLQLYIKETYNPSISTDTIFSGGDAEDNEEGGGGAEQQMDKAVSAMALRKSILIDKLKKRLHIRKHRRSRPLIVSSDVQAKAEKELEASTRVTFKAFKRVTLMDEKLVNK